MFSVFFFFMLMDEWILCFMFFNFFYFWGNGKWKIENSIPFFVSSCFLDVLINDCDETNNLTVL